MQPPFPARAYIIMTFGLETVEARSAVALGVSCTAGDAPSHRQDGGGTHGNDGGGTHYRVRRNGICTAGDAPTRRQDGGNKHGNDGGGTYANDAGETPAVPASVCIIVTFHMAGGNAMNVRKL